jgi:uncharacterized protein
MVMRDRWLVLPMVMLLGLGTACADQRPLSMPALPPVEIASPKVRKVVEAAIGQIGVTNCYDPAYVGMAYPGGDVPLETGVCTDVVIRALRSVGVDLQQVVHEDMRRNFAAYPQDWGLSAPDANIDHRRVPNLMRLFERQGKGLVISRQGKDYLPGDLVTWDLGGGDTHIGIVSHHRSAFGTPLIVHNVGVGTKLEDVLFRWKILGHYRVIE